mgnify:CR=1 FL=1
MSLRVRVYSSLPPSLTRNEECVVCVAYNAHAVWDSHLQE